MNQKNGLLAFLCTLVAAACALLQIPVVSGLEEFGRLFAATNPEDLPALAIHLAPTSTPQLPTDSAAALPLTLYELRGDHRADAEIAKLSESLKLPASLLKAHLVRTSRGVLGKDGLYWSALPEGTTEPLPDGTAKMEAAAALLQRFRQETGSLPGALLAWKAGPFRARRVVDHSGPGLEETLTSLRRHMLAAYREDARDWLCTVNGLALALDARWPVADLVPGRAEKGFLRLTAKAGVAVVSPMAGRIVFTGNDRVRGLCVEVLHACEMRTQLCGLAAVAGKKGDTVDAGEKVGTAGEAPLWFGLKLGPLPLDPLGLALIAPDKVPHPADEPAPRQQPDEE